MKKVLNLPFEKRISYHSDQESNWMHDDSVHVGNWEVVDESWLIGELTSENNEFLEMSVMMTT